MVSRRTFLLGALGSVVLAAGGSVVAIEDGVLPGRTRLAALAGACDVDAVPTAGPIGAITSGQFTSSARGRDVGWSLALPPGHAAAGLPVALVLHGRGEDHSSGFAQLKLHQFLAAYTRTGGTPFALAAVDGGNSYWHPRSDGDNPLRMLTQEFVPMLGRLGLRIDAIGVLGWSMGGYGALLFAREANRGTLFGAEAPVRTTVVAAAASSPALFASYHASASGAFDSAGGLRAVWRSREPPGRRQDPALCRVRSNRRVHRRNKTLSSKRCRRPPPATSPRAATRAATGDRSQRPSSASSAATSRELPGPPTHCPR